MKIGIGLQNYLRYDKERYNKIKEHGFSCVDYNMMSTEVFPYISELNETENALLEEKKLADASGIEIYQVHGPWSWPPKDLLEKDQNERLKKMEKSIWATSVLGCKNWVIHPIMPYGIEEKDTENAKRTWDINFNFMSKLLKIAKEYNVTICLENMPMLKFSLAKPEKIYEFVKTINDDNFKMCLDTGHVATFSDLSAGNEVRKYGEEIRTFHIHDSVSERDLHLLPYFGSIDWEDFSKALNDINYKGALCLETAPPEELPNDVYEELSFVLAKLTKKIAEGF